MYIRIRSLKQLVLFNWPILFVQLQRQFYYTIFFHDFSRKSRYTHIYIYINTYVLSYFGYYTFQNIWTSNTNIEKIQLFYWWTQNNLTLLKWESMPQGSRWFSKFTINLHKRTYGGQKIYQTLNIVFFLYQNMSYSQQTWDIY